jgi:hypothetical protein
VQQNLKQNPTQLLHPSLNQTGCPPHPSAAKPQAKPNPTAASLPQPNRLPTSPKCSKTPSKTQPNCCIPPSTKQAAHLTQPNCCIPPSTQQAAHLTQVQQNPKQNPTQLLHPSLNPIGYPPHPSAGKPKAKSNPTDASLPQPNRLPTSPNPTLQGNGGGNDNKLT